MEHGFRRSPDSVAVPRRRPGVRRDGRRRRWAGRGGAPTRQAARRRRCLGGPLRLPPGTPQHALALGADALVRQHTRRSRRGRGRPICWPGATGSTRRDSTRRSRQPTRRARPGRSWPAPMRHRPCSPRTVPSCSGSSSIAWPARGPCSQKSGSRGPRRAARRSRQADPRSGRDRRGWHPGRQDLIAEGLPVEMADRDTIVALVTVADDDVSVGRLVDALAEALERHRGEPAPSSRPPLGTSTRSSSRRPARRSSRGMSRFPRTLRSDGRAPSSSRPTRQGVPVLAPGEQVTAAAVEALRTAQAHGTRVAYAADPSRPVLNTIAGSRCCEDGDEPPAVVAEWPAQRHTTSSVEAA